MTKINNSYITQKIDHYGISDYAEKLEARIANIDEIVSGNELKNQMTRFLPQDVLERTILKDKYIKYMSNEIVELLSTVREII